MTRSTLEAAISTLQVKEDPESPSSPTTSIQLRKDEIPFVYFDELDGYFYVQTLGSGEYANAHLCSSRVTGALTVRKEEKHTVDVFHREGTFKVTDIVQLFADEGRPVTRQANAPSYEVHITSRLQHIPGVVKLEGCVLHCGQPVDSNNPIPPKQGLGSTPDRGLQVSYWKYYNLGSIDNVVDNRHSTQRYTPRNWLVNYNNDLPSVYLADFGGASQGKDFKDVPFAQLAAMDFYWLHDIIATFLKINSELLNAIYLTQGGLRHLQDFSQSYSASFLILIETFCSFTKKHKDIGTLGSLATMSSTMHLWQQMFQEHAVRLASKQTIPPWTLLPKKVDNTGALFTEMRSRYRVNHYKLAYVSVNQGGFFLDIRDTTRDGHPVSTFQSIGKRAIKYKAHNEQSQPIYQILQPST